MRRTSPDAARTLDTPQPFVDDDDDSGVREAQQYAASTGTKAAAHREAEESQIKVRAGRG